MNNTTMKQQDGEIVAILTHGQANNAVEDACQVLLDRGYRPGVFKFSADEPTDAGTVRRIAYDYDVIVTVEDPEMNENFGTSVAVIIAETRPKRGFLIRFGQRDSIGDASQDRNCSLDGKAIAERILKALRGE